MRPARVLVIGAVVGSRAMLTWTRRLLPLVAVMVCIVATSTVAARTTRGGPLTGTWSGYIAGKAGSGVKRQHIVVVVNAKETGGSWKLSAACYGPLTLDSISNGYHHYMRRRGRGVKCAVGDIDWLVSVDSTIVRAHQHAAGARKGGSAAQLSGAPEAA